MPLSVKVLEWTFNGLTNLSGLIKNIVICVLKMNQSCICLEQHESEFLGGTISIKHIQTLIRRQTHRTIHLLVFVYL